MICIVFSSPLRVDRKEVAYISVLITVFCNSDNNQWYQCYPFLSGF